jgi:hypothetical protein
MRGKGYTKPRQLQIALLLQVLILGVQAPSTVLAAGNAACTNSGSPDNRHALSLRVEASAGAEAKIDRFPPQLCTNLTDGLSGSFTYVSVEAGGNAIIQIGIIKCKVPGHSACDGTYRWAFAWGRQQGVGSCTSTAVAIARSAGPAAAGLHKFTVYRSANKVHFKVDDGSSYQDSIDISNVGCWSGSQMTAGGETLDLGDQLGGLAGDPQHITNALWEKNVGGVWASPSFTTCESSASIYRCARINGQAVDIWTDRS